MDGEKRSRKRVLGLVTLLVAIALLEGGAALALFASNRFLGEQFYTRRAILDAQEVQLTRYLEDRDPWDPIDSLLGWRPRPSTIRDSDTINAQGLRGSREYSAAVPPDTVRVSAFGDSFVYCSEVLPPDCWTAQMEKERSVQVLNFGVPGYGTDQAFLRYLDEGPQAGVPSTVLIGFAPVNVRRNANRYRLFISPGERGFKPRFIVENGELELLVAPVRDTAGVRAFAGDLDALRRAGVNDYWYEPMIWENPFIDWLASVRLASWFWVKLKNRYLDPDRMWTDDGLNPESSLFDLQVRLLESFADSVSSRGGDAHFVMLPDRNSVSRAREGLPTSYAAIPEHLGATGRSAIDPIQALVDSPLSIEDLFMPEGHYTAGGNRIIAGVVATELGLAPR